MYAELYGRNTKFGMAVLGVFTMSFHPPAALSSVYARGGRDERILPAFLRTDKTRPYV